jgi:hypothetical protein
MHSNFIPYNISGNTECHVVAIGLVLDFIRHLVCGRQKIPQHFGDWICLRPQVDGAGQTYSVGPVRKS